MIIKTINIIGAGSLGSFTTQVLTKMNRTWQCDINVWDFDTVEERNVDNQLFSLKDVGTLKVKALAEIIQKLGNSDIGISEHKFEEKKDLRGIVIAAVDSMRVRKEILATAKFNMAVDYLIEARMGAHLAKIFALDPRNPEAIKLYEQQFYSDEEAENPICATNETIPTLGIVASSIGHLITLYYKSVILQEKYLEITVNLVDLPLVNSEGCALI